MAGILPRSQHVLDFGLLGVEREAVRHPSLGVVELE